MGKIRKKWSDSQLEAALKEAKLGRSFSAVGKKHGIPKATIYTKVKGLRPIGKNPGPSPVLSVEEEAKIVKWMLYLSKRGFPVSKNQLINNVAHLLKHLERKTPFTNGRPGRHWSGAFLRRHPELTTRVAQNLTKRRPSVTEEALRRWFVNVQEHLDTEGLTNIEAHRIFNCDESAFFLCPKGERVLVKKGDKAVYNFTQNDDKECLTVLFMTNACGALPSPMIVFPYSRIPYTVAQSMPDEWSIGKSENGWMTAENFYEYISNIFEPWLTKNNIERPVILYVDGHSSHVTMHLAEFCLKKDIELIALYPNATHLLQPLDVALFRPLKGTWRTCVTDWQTKNQRKMRREDFGPLLKQAVSMVDLPRVMSSGFRTTGLHPFSPNALDYNELPKKERNDNADVPPPIPSVSQNDAEKHLRFIEANISNELLQEFLESHKSGTWLGSNENTGLFLLWQKTVGLSGQDNPISEPKNHEEFDEVVVYKNDLVPNPSTSNPNVDLEETNYDEVFCSFLEDNKNDAKYISTLDDTPQLHLNKDQYSIPDKQNLTNQLVFDPENLFSNTSIVWDNYKEHDSEIGPLLEKEFDGVKILSDVSQDFQSIKKQKPKVKIPSIATSAAWQEKEMQKNMMLAEVENRKRKRAAAAEEKVIVLRKKKKQQKLRIEKEKSKNAQKLANKTTSNQK